MDIQNYLSLVLGLFKANKDSELRIV